MSEKAFQRMGRLADGWFPLIQPGAKLAEARATIARSAEAAGRDPAEIKMEGRVDWRGDVDDVKRRAEGWREAGATHLSINTMGANLGPVDGHIGALATVALALELG